MFEEILLKIAFLLDKYRVPYIIIGGQAVLLYGEPRVTRDIDITLGIGPGHFDVVAKICNEFPLKILPESPESFVQETMVLPCMEEETGIRIDFIFSITTFEREAIERARVKEIKGQKVCYASVEDLIVFKLVAGRERDLEDIKSIINMQENIDRQRIERYAKAFDEEMNTNILGKWKEVISVKSK